MDKELALGVGMDRPIIAGAVFKPADCDGTMRFRHFGWIELVCGDLSLARQNTGCYQSPETRENTMNKLEIGPLHERLKLFVGEWEGEEQIFPNPWGPSGPGRGHWKFWLDPSGFNLIHDFSEVRDSGYRFDAHGVLTVDPAANAFVWFWFDSYGYPPLNPSRGTWQGSGVTLEKTTPRGVSRSVFELAKDSLGYRVESKVAGSTQFAPVMAGRFVRMG